MRVNICLQARPTGACHSHDREGLTDAQICRSIKDPKQNKSRNLDQLVEHLTEDKLVVWAWSPGEGRTAVPMPHDEFAAKVKRWQAAGAPCP